MNIASLPLDFEIGYYHMMSAMMQPHRRHVSESYSRSGKPSIQIIKNADGDHPIQHYRCESQSSVKVASA